MRKARDPHGLRTSHVAARRVRRGKMKGSRHVPRNSKQLTARPASVLYKGPDNTILHAAAQARNEAS